MQTTLQTKNSSMMLTGGRTAEALYREFRKNRVIEQFPETIFYIGDERVLPPSHQYSNSRMIIDVLFNGQSPDRFNPINGNSKNPTEEAADYAQQLPDTIDLILLSVGEDGHTASLFPHSQQLDSQQKVEVVTHSPKYPKNRITITPKVI